MTSPPLPFLARTWARLLTGPVGHLVAGVADVGEGAVRYGAWRLRRRVAGRGRTSDAPRPLR